MGEKLREEAFPFIEFRPSLIGRQAYVKGTSLAVWEVVLVARHLDMEPQRVAGYLEWPEERVQAALAYARANPAEIAAAVGEVEPLDFEDLKRRIPWLCEARV